MLIISYNSSKYITDKLLQYCTKLCDASITSQRKTLDNAWFVVPFESDGHLIQFQKTAESLVVSKHPIKPIENISNAESELPSIYPLSGHISIDKENLYELQNIYRESNVGLEKSKFYFYFFMIFHYSYSKG